MDIKSMIRNTIQKVLDEIQFRFDVFPGAGYQPLPWVGINKAKRGEGTKARLEAIETSLTGLDIRSGMDIGCNSGYFCFGLAQKGIPMLGIDMDAQNIRIAHYAYEKIGKQTIALCRMAINTETLCLLPTVDLVLVLSIWHHWIRSYGLDVASQILSTLWEKSGKVLYFETGEDEITADFGMPDMGESPRSWLENYLGTICVGSEIIHLGQFKGFAPAGNENRNVVYRNLFKITRKGT